MVKRLPSMLPYTEEHHQFREMVADFIAKDCVPRHEEWEKAGEVTRDATRETEPSTSMLGKCPATARSRVSTTWPSRMDRAASAIGSLWSSPSTSTV